ncbi:MAG: hypothetical protein Q7I99_03805 [Acholeplasmataceae bacterium]|nr:hypothetical protein [Acholeplasmataceae bacterium]
MTLEDFISKYDNEISIILLEGKRNVLESDKGKLFELGKLLTSKSANMLFRSGNAEGADQYFSDGVASVDYTRLQVITPYSGHRKEANKSYSTFSLGDVDLLNSPNVIYQSKANKKTENLIDRFVSGEKNRYTIKAAYIIRDTVKVLGTNKIKPATFGIFYDDILNPQSGGTGHTMNVCSNNNVPYCDQQVWFGWLDEKI